LSLTQFDFVVNSNLQRRVSLSYTVQRDNKKNDGAKESLKPLEQKLRKIEDMTNDIREELRHHREREAEHRDANGT
ncbi:emp24/gp25L/p24 family protein, partial [Pseudomonas aeruginosa]|uniref:emp24/gp25L/p24 family protein n=1 Tax=Pseudomonas aeruginosa TaxID=287 RepID=UPI001CC00B26